MGHAKHRENVSTALSCLILHFVVTCMLKLNLLDERKRLMVLARKKDLL